MYSRIAMMAVGVGLVVAGCSGGTASLDPSPTITGRAEFATMDELREAFVSSGGVCEEPKPDGPADALIVESIRCGFRGEQLTLYTQEGLTDTIARATIETMAKDGTDGGVVYGPNWLIAVPVSGTVVPLAETLDADFLVNVRQGGRIPITRLEWAASRCKLTAEHIAIGDDGHTLTLDGSLPLSDSDCVLNEVNAPDSVLARIGETRALDGMQDADWGSLAATWTYHPDDGLNLILTSTD